MFGLVGVLLERTASGEPQKTSDREDSGPKLMWTSLSLMFVMMLVMAARIYCRAFLIRRMGSDDWCMVMAALSAIGLVMFGVAGVLAGDRFTEQWQDAAYSQKMGYGAQIFYFLSLGFCKASLLLFIIRLTPSERMIILTWSVLAFTTAATISAFVSSCLQCIPVSYLWDQLNPNLRGTIEAKCVNQTALQFALPAINIVTDFCVWLLPIKMVWNIHLPPRDKWSLIAVFSLGGMGVIAAILRLYSVHEAYAAGAGEEGTHKLRNVAIWSNVEAHVSIMFGSAPAAKPFFSHFLPSLFGSSFKSQSGDGDGAGNRPPSGLKFKSRGRGNRRGSYVLESIAIDGSPAENSSTVEFVGAGATNVEGARIGDAESEMRVEEGGVLRSGEEKAVGTRVVAQEML